MPDDFRDYEIKKFLCEGWVEPSLLRHTFQPCDLGRFTVWIGRGQIVFGFEFTDSLSLRKTLGQCVDENGIETVDAVAVFFKQRCGAGSWISHDASLLLAKAAKATKP